MSEISLREQKQLIADIRSSNPQLKGKTDKEVLSILTSENHNIILTPEQQNSILQISQTEANTDNFIKRATTNYFEKLNKPIENLVENITHLSYEEAQDLSIDLLLQDIENALRIYQGINDGIVGEGYDKFKEFLDLNVTSENLKEILDKNAVGIHYLQKAKEGTLTKKEYYLENISRLEKMILDRMKKLDPINFRLDRKTYEKIAEDYVKMFTGQISSMEEIKELQHKILTMSEEEEVQFAQSFATKAVDKAKNTKDDVDTSFNATVDLKSQHPYFTDEPLEFEDVYKLEYGVDFSRRAMEKYLQAKGEADFVNGAYAKVQNLKNVYEQNNKKYLADTEIIYDESGNEVFVPEEPNPDDRKDEILNVINEYFLANPSYGVEQLKEINDKQKLNLTIYQNAGGQIAIDFTGYQTDDKSRNKALNLLLRGLTNAQQMKFEEDILQGKKYEDFVEAKTNAYKKAFGEQNSEELANAFQQDQATFVDKATGALSTGGLIALCVGGVMSWFPPTTAAGLLLVSVGGKTALVGQAADVSLGLADAYTRDEINQEEVERTWKDAGMMVASMAFGAFAGAKGLKWADDILSKGGSIASARAAQISTDFGISLVGDLAMVGLLNYDQDLMTTIKQNGIGILVSALTGNYIGNSFYKDVAGKNADITYLRKNPTAHDKYISTEDYIKGIEDKKVAEKLRSAAKSAPEFVHQLIQMEVEIKPEFIVAPDYKPQYKPRFDAKDITILAELYKQKPELTKLIVEMRNTDGKYLNNDISDIHRTLTFDIDEKTLTEFLSMHDSNGDVRFHAGDYLNSVLEEVKNNTENARKIIEWKNPDGSYRFDRHLLKIIENLDEVAPLIAEKLPDGKYRFSEQNISDLIGVKKDAPGIYDIIVNEVDAKGNKRTLEQDKSVYFELRCAYIQNPDRLIKLLRLKDKNGNFMYDTNLIADKIDKYNGLSDDVFEKIYTIPDVFLDFNHFDSLLSQNCRLTNENCHLITDIYNKCFEGNNTTSYDEITDKCYKAIAEVKLKAELESKNELFRAENQKYVEEFLENADAEILEDVILAKNPIEYVRNSNVNLILANIENTKSLIKDEKVLAYVDELLDKSLWDSSYLFKAQEIVDIYNSAMGNYITTDKNTEFMQLLEFARKNNPELAEELNLYKDPTQHPEYETIRADFIKETQYSELIEYCKKSDTDPQMADYLYKELYLKNENFPEDVRKNLVDINEKYGVKIFLSTDMQEAFKSTDFIDEELTKWQKASGAKAKIIPTLDLLTSKRNYVDDKSAYGQSRSGGFCETSNGAVSIDGNSFESVKHALRHEIMHANDTKKDCSFPDDAGYTNKTKYREEFEKIGISKDHIDYAYNNPDEFIAVAAEGDLSKCSPEFRQVLIDFGMPKWVFNLDKVDISEVRPNTELTVKAPEKPSLGRRILNAFGLSQKPEEVVVNSAKVDKVKPNHWAPFKKFYKTDIDKAVDDILKHYSDHEEDIRGYIEAFGFKDLGEFSARIKSDYSLRDKIKSYLKKHPSATHKDVWDEIRDCFGFRTIIEPKDYTNHPKVKKLIEAGDMKGAMTRAAELQSQPAVEKIKEIILANENGDNSISVARISIYVSKDGVPYFSEAQLADLKQFGLDHGVEIDYVKKASPDDIKSGEMNFDADPTTRSQPSGYTALQMNFVTKDGDTIEWQFRGKDVDRFAEGEHIPYDLRTGKDITGGNSDLEVFYKDFKNLLSESNMEPDVYKAYNKYLNAHYTHLRKVELGFDSTPPKLQDFAPDGFTFNNKLEAENLIKLSNIAHNLKDGKISLKVALEQYNNI